MFKLPNDIVPQLPFFPVILKPPAEPLQSSEKLCALKRVSANIDKLNFF